jgi:uncharacterized membrane protein YbhN (UPF0104 family)
MKRTYWIVALKAALGAMLFAALYRAAGARGMFATLRVAHAREFWTACALMGVALVFNGLRWWVVMRTIERPIPLRNAMMATFEAMFFQQVVPAGVGGDVSRGVRAYDLGVSPQWAFVGVAIDRAAGLLFVALTLILAAAIAQSAIVATRPFAVLFLGAGGIVAGAAFAALMGAVRLPGWLEERAPPLVALLRAYWQCMRSRRFLSLALVCLAASNSANIASFFYCARALGLHVGAWDAGIVIQGMVLVSMLPLSVGGWGLRESAAVLLFAPLGVDAAHAMAVSVLFGLILTLFGGIGAVVWIASRYRRSFRSSADDANWRLSRAQWERPSASAETIDGEATSA